MANSINLQLGDCPYHTHAKRIFDENSRFFGYLIKRDDGQATIRPVQRMYKADELIAMGEFLKELPA